MYDWNKIIDIEKLLDRKESNIDPNYTNSSITGQTILITGAGGSIGSELVRQCIQLNAKKIIGLDWSENALQQLELSLPEQSEMVELLVRDIGNSKSLDAIFTKNKPTIVIHAAAYKQVPRMENNIVECCNNNVLKTWHLANQCISFEVAKFILISSDKAVDPVGIMGKSKRAAELLISSLEAKRHNTKFITTRFGNVIGSNSSVIHTFLHQIIESKPITVTSEEMSRYFMTISEACHLVLESAHISKGNDLFLFDMGEPVHILQLVDNLINQVSHGLNVKSEIKYTGLRNGEKIEERLIGEKETAEKTVNPSILKINLNQNNREVQDVSSLQDAIKAYDEKNVLSEIGKILNPYN